MFNTDQEVLKNKGSMMKNILYMITKSIILQIFDSLVDSEYSVSLITSLRNQILYSIWFLYYFCISDDSMGFNINQSFEKDKKLY